MKHGYKQTEGGVVPEEWEVKPLGKVLSKGRLGGNYANQLRMTDYPLMKMGNIARGYMDTTKIEYITPGIMPEQQHKLRNGDVLFNTRNTLDLVGKVAIWRDELPVAYYNSNLMRLEFDPQQVCSNEYANAALNAHGAVSVLRGLATGTTSVAAIYTRDLLSMPFIRPPLPEQRAIAKALSDMDGLLGGLDRVIAKKRDLKQAAMQQLLTGKTRLPGFHGAWEVKTLGDNVEKIVGGGTPSRANPAFWGNEIPWITVKDFATFDPRRSQESITRVGLRNSSSHLIPAGTLITSTRMALGKAVVYEVDVAINQDLKALFLKSDRSVAYFTHWFDHFGGMIDELGSGSTVKGISLIELKRFPFRAPFHPEQTAIAELLTEMDAELAVLEQRREKTRALKQAIMQELLTGKIRLV